MDRALHDPGQGHVPEPAEESEREANRNRPVVLVVEDHADVRAYLRDHLAERYVVVEARDGAEGLDRARRHRPDLIIADAMMPEVDGFTLCRRVKADDAIQVGNDFKG